MFKNHKKKILNKISKIDRTDFNYKFLIKEIAYLILKVENVLFNHNLAINPEIIVINYLDDFYKRLNLLDEISRFSNNELINKQKFKLEKNHRVLFQKLWTYYNLKEFQNERIGRYTRRIKLNKLVPIIKNKSCVDFGCGHGNFLSALIENGAKDGVGIDYGGDSIK